MGDEERGKPFFSEWIERPERLRRRARRERNELRRLLEPEQRSREPVRRLAELRGPPVCLELALGREQEMHAGRRDRPEHEEEPALQQSADTAQLDQRR